MIVSWKANYLTQEELMKELSSRTENRHTEGSPATRHTMARLSRHVRALGWNIEQHTPEQIAENAGLSLIWVVLLYSGLLNHDELTHEALSKLSNGLCVSFESLVGDMDLNAIPIN